MIATCNSCTGTSEVLSCLKASRFVSKQNSRQRNRSETKLLLFPVIANKGGIHSTSPGTDGTGVRGSINITTFGTPCKRNSYISSLIRWTHSWRRNCLVPLSQSETHVYSCGFRSWSTTQSEVVVWCVGFLREDGDQVVPQENSCCLFMSPSSH